MNHINKSQKKSQKTSPSFHWTDSSFVSDIELFVDME